MHKTIRLLLAAALAAAPSLAAAQAWPSRSVTIAVSTGSGTSPDRIARIFAERLAKDLGQPFVVENMAGGGGVIAPRTVARAAPDGYMMLFGGVDTLVTNPFTVKDLGYDPEKDFELVSMIYKEGSLSLVVHPSVPAKTLAEWFALAKKSPGKMTYGTTSTNFVILFGQWVHHLAGAEALAVAYKSPAQQFQDILSGRINAVITSPPAIDPHMRAGKLRVLAVDGSRRYPPWPDVPLFSETFPGFRLSGTGVLVAPRGTPAAVVKRAHGAMAKIVTDKSYQDALLTMGFTIEDAGTPESMRQHLNDRKQAWQKVFAGLNIRPE